MTTQHTHGPSRRGFLSSSLAAGVALTLANASSPLAAAAAVSPVRRMPIGGFTKELQHLSYDELADVVATLGWDGIEVAVRPGGYVLPEKVQDELPKLVETLKKRNLRILVMVTAIRSADEKYAQTTLQTAARLGVTHYRLGWHTYDQTTPIIEQLEKLKPQMRALTALNKELGIVGCYQNHSGTGVGSPVWDAYELIKDLDPKHMATQFDIAHATIEGGNAWRIDFRLMQSRLGAVAVKDFTWKVTPGKGATSQWAQLGQGNVNPAFFDMLLKTGFSGPMTVHVEYRTEGTDKAETTRNHIAALKRDTQTLKGWLKM